LRTCISELVSKRLVQRGPSESTLALLSYKTLIKIKFFDSRDTSSSLKLLEIARKIEGASGRSLRKLPFIAYAEHSKSRRPATLELFLQALSTAALRLIQAAN
jgi:hypothetical protein